MIDIRDILKVMIHMGRYLHPAAVRIKSVGTASLQLYRTSLDLP